MSINIIAELKTKDGRSEDLIALLRKLCNRHLGQLDTSITLASSICRNPSITLEERRRRQTLLELLVDKAEEYQQELECDRELYQVIALDAKGVPQSRITARHAANLLAEEISQRAGETIAATDA
jgi:hypothetical protein